MANQKFHDDPAGFGVGYPVIGTNSVAFAEADPVYINTSGFLDLVTTTSKILGFSVDTITTLASDNQTVAKVCPKYVYADAVLMEYPAAVSGFTQAQVGDYVNFSGVTSGAFTLNQASTSAVIGQVLIVGFNPNAFPTTDDGGTNVAVVRAAYHQTDTYAVS